MTRQKFHGLYFRIFIIGIIFNLIVSCVCMYVKRLRAIVLDLTLYKYRMYIYVAYLDLGIYKYCAYFCTAYLADEYTRGAVFTAK